ncbi:MAG: signal peptidase I [Clostridia bacterium]|nr:signal peptidase I [Clostridia bacterium]
MNRELKIILKIILIGIIIFCINQFFFQICFVQGNSMSPTLQNGNIMCIKKFGLNLKHNDIVVINKNNKIITKRLVGLPNDKIRIDEYLYVNGQKNDDLFIEDCGEIKEEITLKEDEYFVLGDNRSHSIDSRFAEIGIIHKNEIIGIKII